VFQWFCKAPKLFVSVDEAVIESHDVSSSDRQGVTSILWENTAKLFDATSIAGSLIAHLGSFCDGHLSFRMSAIFKVQCKRRVDSVAASPREYLVRRPAKNVNSPPQPPPKKKKKTHPQETTMQKSRVSCKFKKRS